MKRRPQCNRVENDDVLTYNAHGNFVGYFKIDPQLNPLRDEPHFAGLLKKAGFPQ
jgi:hypothetical protein